VKSRSDEMISVIHDRFGKIDALVNKLGVIQVEPLEVMTQEDFAQAMNAHFSVRDDRMPWSNATAVHAMPISERKTTGKS
jgi:NAD(P)-dependent dehydrogenase (short-subunit alcohol dehydrogenase family)